MRDLSSLAPAAEAATRPGESEQQKRTKVEQNKADRAEKSRDKQEREDKGSLLNL